MRKEIDDLLALPTLDDQPVPETFAAFERRFQGLESLSEQLESGAARAELALRFASAGGKKAAPKDLAPEDTVLLAGDVFTDQGRQVEARLKALHEQAVELRVRRLELADEVLANSNELVERLQAAFVVDQDGKDLVDLFAGATPFERESLRDPQLAQRIAALHERAWAAAGEDLLKKSNLLFSGLHWWLRGRYGLGTEGRGLLKSELALTDLDSMYALYMPPRYSHPAYPARFPYLWQFETRKIRVDVSPWDQQPGDPIKRPAPPGVTGITYRATRISAAPRRGSRLLDGIPNGARMGGAGSPVAPRGYRGAFPSPPPKKRSKPDHLIASSYARVTEENRSLIYRVVGYLEYANALRYLNELVSICSPDEIKAIDALIAGRSEFDVPGIPAAAAPDAAATSPTKPAPRRGLAWIMAFAQLELGGILATFDDNDMPYDEVDQGDFCDDEYRQLLMDAARFQARALVEDPSLAEVAKSKPDSTMLAYIRRLNAAQRLLRAAGHRNLTQLTPEQLAEFQRMDKAMTKFREALRESVSEYLAKNTGITLLPKMHGMLRASAGQPLFSER
jgi:hypothetical protein